MPTYETQAVSVDDAPEGQIWLDVTILRDGEQITVIRTRHNAASDNQTIVDNIRETVLRHAKVDAGIIEGVRADKLAEHISGRTFEL